MVSLKLWHCVCSIIVALLALTIFLVNYQLDITPDEYSLPPLPKLEAVYTPNTLLRNAKLVLKNRVIGPESLLIEEGGHIMYTGTWDAKVLKIVDGVIVNSVQLHTKGGSKRPEICGTFDTEPVCGRPLGIRRLDEKKLVVADAYLGLFTVDFDNDKDQIQQIFSPDQKSGGDHMPKFMNDLDVLYDGRTVFFSDSSSKWDRAHFLHAFLEHKADGRVYRLDLAAKKATVLLHSLHFPNGIQIHPDNSSLLISECSMARIVRYYFTGPKKGQRDLFISNLPGFPDNIRLSHGGKSFLIGLAAVRHQDEHLSFMDMLGPYPYIRKLIAQIIPERYLIPLFQLLSKKHGFVLEVDLTGKPIRSYQDPGGVVISDVSQASDDETHLYLGSFHSDFIAKVPKKG